MSDISLGFIILRHVNNDRTNLYWQKCYDCIRKFYASNQIVIIDDNSNPIFVTTKEMTNCIILQSEYPGRGELLPYIYFLRHDNWFETAVILHDSVFINALVNFQIPHYRRLWSFEHHWDNETEEEEIIRAFNNPAFTQFFQMKRWWKGCFGAMTSIRKTYLTYVNQRLKLDTLIPFITSRTKRMCFERVLACMLDFCYQEPFDTKIVYTSPILGDIHQYGPWGITFDNYESYNHLPVIKTWTGR